MKVLLIVVLVLLPLHTYGQIPTVCSDANSLGNSICCPDTSDGVCGESAGRGACVSLSLSGYDSGSSHVRDNWPHYYTQMCSCNGGYGGIDCSRCKIGYYGSDCSRIDVTPRREVGSYTPAEWDEFNRVLRLTREYDSGYQVVLKEEVPGTEILETTNASLYGLYVWMHHYAAKDSLASLPDLRDYAHSAPGFTTWHRYHTLWFEWEIQGMLKQMGDPNYHTFRFAYWDWRVEILNSSGITTNDLFTEERIGATYNVGGYPRVNGTVIGDGWDTICWLTLFDICDPRNSTGPLQRCPFTGTNPCDISNPDWATIADVDKALNEDSYDFPPYNILTIGGYRAVVDFLVGTLSLSECGDDRLCQCLGLSGSDTTCDSLGVTFKANMHSKIHFILGVGDLTSALTLELTKKGHLEDVAASPNDPVFIFHHLTLDCMFEEWMQSHPDEGYPTFPLQNPGHKIGDYMVPFMPLYTQGDMFVPGSTFGFSCSLPNITVSHATTFSHLSLCVILLFCLLTLLL
ncbi:Tyrosinase b precursor [Oopsacas minuta]|uniref:Tyrosinase b n=1 Tax=Oopsacas minuta TaxID=111878 RepID=A0AAV7JPI2_9METZ|nr:Tyrosinase b precursor [Oopsacas minuta]